ncbi:MAG: gliding motility-associated C-terminal domain-containing protein [Bacteroidia bacterium]
MKKKLLAKSVTLLLVATLLSPNIFAQNSGTNWLIHYNYSKDRVFLENKGQFSNEGNGNSAIKYGFDDGQSKIYFTDKGILYRFDKKEDTPQNNEAGDKDEHKITVKTDIVSAIWEGANSNVQIIGESPRSDYFSYSINNNGILRNINHIAAFQKIIYKNLYPNIDVEYIFHPDEGIEYSLILHPGADINQVKLKYSDGHRVRLVDGDTHITTSFGDIIDHAPLAFYSDNHSNIISSRFVKNSNTIFFGLVNYDTSKEVTIDPWTIAPAFSNSNKVWNTQVDAAGNVYLYGGDSPLALKKYSAAGLLQWTYNTPWDSANYWMGTMITDLAGNSYVTSGSNGEISKITTGGALVWHNNPNGLFGPLFEYWHLAFNCDQTQLVVGGMKTPSAFSINGYRGAIMTINLANGSITNTIIVGGFSGLATIHEVRAICPSSNGNFYFMTLDSIGSVTPALTLNYKSINGYNFSYGSPSYTVKGNLGLNAMKTNGNFIYTQNGKTVDKRNISNGAIIASSPIPGGISSSFFGASSPGNSGLDIDSCGNVYVGSGNQVVQYDANLNQLSTAATPSAVYDVAVNKNGEVIACGNGFATSLAMANCHPIKSICVICVPPTINITALPTTICAGSNTVLTASGGTTYSWSTGATTNPITLNPATTTTYTVTGTTGGCSGTATVTVIVNPLPTVAVNSPTICAGTSATLTGTGATTYSWSTGATTNPITVNPASATSYTVTGTTGGCSGTAVATVTVVPSLGITINPSPVTICAGTNTTLTASGGTTYSWSTGATTNPITLNPASTTTYTVTGTTGGCTGTSTVTVTVNPLPTVSVNSPTICAGTNTTLTASGGTTYSWSTGATTNPITVNPAATTTYTVTGTTGGCSGTAVATVTVNPLPVVTVNSPTICAGTNTTLTASGGTTYSWSTGATTNPITVNPASTTTYTVTGTKTGCTGSITATVTVDPAIVLNPSSTPATCGGSNGSVGVAASGGIGTYTYSWNPGGAGTASVANLSSGSYTVTVTDASGCTQTAIANITNTGGITSVTNSATPATCGKNNGKDTITSITGGTSPYTYSWSGGQTTSGISGQAAGTYNVTVTDANGCKYPTSVIIPGTPAVSITMGVATNVSCNGGNNGKDSIIVSGGTGSYTYSWNTIPPQSSATATGLAMGNYTVTVTDASGCSATGTINITQPTKLDTSTSYVNELCNGGNNGTATVNVTGGTGAYTYVWTPNVSSTGTATALSAGAYSLTVKDANGCSISKSFTITQPSAIVLNTSSTPATCGLSNGTTTVNSNGGTGSYTYSWNSIPAQTTQTATGLNVGTYTATVTDANGCTQTASATVSVGLVTININPSPVSICLGDSTLLTASGASTYSWSPATGLSSSTVSNPTAKPISTTTYTVTGTSGICTASASVVVTVNLLPVITVNPSPANICQGSSTILTANGAVTYAWIPNTGLSSTTGSSVTASPASTITYTVTGTNAAGCSNNITVKVIVNPKPIIDSLSAIVSPPLCKGMKGSISGIVVTGGTSPYTYLWTPTGQNTVNATGLAAGSYTLTVTDASGCTANSGPYILTNSSVTASFIANPDSGIAPLQVNFTNTSTGANSYEWYLGNGDTTNATNPNTTYQNTGAYNVELIATNANGCKDTAYGKIDVYGQSILIIPNVFSPNGDGKNDLFTVKSSGIVALHGEIFDRWGIKLYSWDGSSGGWNGVNTSGVEVPAGTYYYLITATGVDGKKYVEKGYLTLLR